ncbi:MAG: membrane protein insertion efficiency factor YidD [Bacilli bacterium]|nr:membrane protein insertion efficiency factor YidD [Bacilli bacterium]
MIKKILLILIRFYQRRISVYTRPKCLYSPTCSNYAIIALNKYNNFTAIIKIIKRLSRCNRFYRGEVKAIDNP